MRPCARPWATASTVATTAELINKLREAGRSDIKVIAGGVIPPQDYDYLRDAGVQGIYGPGSNVVECAADVLRLLGHNMPPIGEAA
jgi:methylmalonyl-CoA mutase